jgi:hypothetical protein
MACRKRDRRDQVGGFGPLQDNPTLEHPIRLNRELHQTFVLDFAWPTALATTIGPMP